MVHLEMFMNATLLIRRFFSRTLMFLPALLAALATAPSAQAASATWLATPNSNNWIAGGTTNNWSTGAGTFPGSTSGTSSADIASFTNTSTITTINCASAFVIGGITFDTANASAYTIKTSVGTWRVSLANNPSGAVIKTTPTVVNPQTITGTLRLASTGTLTIISDSTTPSATLNITSGAAANNSGTSGLLVLNGANTGDNIFGAFTEQAAATAPGSFVKTGTGKWIMTGNSTYHGNTTITNGTLALVGNGAMTNSALITISGATLSVSNSMISPNAMVIANSGVLDLTNTFFRTPVTIGTLSATNAIFHLGVNGSTPFTNIVVTSALNTGAGLTFSIDQVVNVPVATTFTLISYVGADPDPSGFTVSVPTGFTVGPVTVDAGNKLVTATITPAAVAGSLVWVGGINSSWDTSTKNWVDLATMSISQAYANPDTAQFDDSAATKTVTLAGTFTPFGVNVNNGSDYTFNGPGKISGAFGVTKQFGGSLTLAETGGDDFAGGLTVNGGTLLLDNANSAISGNVTVSGGATLQIGNNDANGNLPSGIVSVDGTLVFSRSDNLSAATPITGFGGLVQNGAGTLTLSNANPYSGTTAILKGKLALIGSGAISNSSSLVISNAAFDVSAIQGATVLNDFNITNAAITVGPTNLVTPLTVNSFEMDGVIAQSNVINVVALPPVASYPSTLTLIKSANPITLSGGNFNFAVGTLPAGFGGSLAESADGTAVQLVLTSGPIGVRPTVVWAGVNDTTVTTNWSDRVNWQLAGVPVITDNVIFDGTGLVGDNATINNVVDNSFTVATLTYNSTAQWHNTLIPANSVLTVTGAAGVGTGVAAGSTTSATISGPGELDVDGAFSLNTLGGTSDSHVNLDMSGLGTFKNDAPATTMALGTVAQNIVSLSLAATNYINVATLNLEATAGANGRAGTLNLGESNIICVSNLNISTGKGQTTKIQFGATAPDGTVGITGTGGGTARSTMILGNATSGTAVCNGQLNLAGHLANVLAGTVSLGGVGGSTGNGSSGTVTLDNGTFDATSILMGNSTSAHSSSGTFTLGGDAGHGATLTVGSGVVLGNASISGGTGTGTLTIGVNGVANISGGITKDTTAGAINTATINLTDGALNLLSGTIGTPAAPIDSLNLSDNGTGDTQLRLNVIAGVTNIAATAIAPSGITKINIDSFAGINGTVQIPIIYYGNGASPIGGLALGTVPGGYTVGNGGQLLDNTANQTIDIVITTPAPLLWKGAVGSTVNGNWDTTTPNWLNGVTPSAYADSKFVLFDDTALSSAVSLAGTVSPGGMRVDNSTLTYSITGAGKISGNTGLLKAGSGTLILDNSGLNDFTGGINITAGTLQAGNNDANGALPAGNIADDGTLTFVRSDNLVVANSISGAGGVSQINTNVLTLAGTNGYTGPTFISNGTLKVNNTNALGSWLSGAVTVTNGGTLDLGGFSTAIPQANPDFGAKQFNIAGSGVGGLGVIVNSGTNQQLSAFQTITLTANATVGGPSRWDMRNGSPVLDLQGFKLTKIGTNQTSLVTVNVTSGDIDINQGTLSFESASSVNGTGTLTVNAGGNLGHFRLANSAITRPIVLNGGAITNLATTGASSVNDAPITLAANSILGGSTSPTNSVTLNGVISGAFGLTKAGNGAFILTANNTYSGSTLINAGALVLAGNASIANSANIAVAAGATLDVSGRTDGTLTLNNNQTLSGSGTVTGIVASASGSTVAPGSATSVGLLTVTGNVSLNGTNVMKLNAASLTNDVLASGGSISYGGTLSLTNLGGSLTTNSSFRLFAASPGNYSGAFSAIIPAIPQAGLAWNTNTLATDGVLRFTASVNVNPTNITTSVSGGNLTLSWPADHTGWRLQVQTNSVNGTNWVDVPGSTSVNSLVVPIGATNNAVFYRQVYP
jgi:fibronectin-binding autotransporter adhesin